MTTWSADPNLDLVLERTVDVAPELVWKAWTTPELIVQWFTRSPGRPRPANSTCGPAASSTR